MSAEQKRVIIDAGPKGRLRLAEEGCPEAWIEADPEFMFPVRNWV